MSSGLQALVRSKSRLRAPRLLPLKRNWMGCWRVGAQPMLNPRRCPSNSPNNLETALNQLENAILKAPFAGTVTAIKANVGELVGTSPIVSLMSTSPALVRACMEESDLAGVDVGDAAAVTFNAASDTSLGGVVTRISPTVALISGVATAEVMIQLDEPDGDVSWFLVGMSADVEITAARDDGAVLVPVEAVRELAPGSYAVFVVKDDGALEMRVVTPDFATGPTWRSPAV